MRVPAILPAIQLWPVIQLLPAILPVIAVSGLLSFSSRLIVLVEAARVEDDSKVGSLGKVVRVLLAVGAGVVLPSQVLGRAIMACAVKACAIKSCAIKAGAVKVSSGSLPSRRVRVLEASLHGRVSLGSLRALQVGLVGRVAVRCQRRVGLTTGRVAEGGWECGRTMPASRRSHYR